MPMAIATKWNKALTFSDFSQMFEYLLSDLICVKLNQQLKNTDLDFSVLAERYSLETLFQFMLSCNSQNNILNKTYKLI